ncbi:MAG TPA: phosphoribosylamine--glycine ligase [Thermoanaerobaculia bacterium]|nr:phosphoribosylamine--glycine ligase [Thermoanaerobaculia bacterium]
MRILVVGSGGREHALVWKLAQSPEATEIFCAPGNPGIAEKATCVPIGVEDVVELADFAESMSIDLTVVGPELPLTLGLVDELTGRGLLAFGPNRLAAELEGSKVFSKSFMQKYGIPTPVAETCRTRAEAEAAVKKVGLPCVFKADGLAAGKGVVIVTTREEADKALRLFFEERVFGSAGDRLLVERFVAGEEVSFLCICDGTLAVPLATTKDYKKVFDGDRGPNTGGMGSHSPSVVLDAATSADVLTYIVHPTLKGMAAEGRPFRGVLYGGLMLENGLTPHVLENHVRFGDPETQSILLRLESDLIPFLVAAARGRLEDAGVIAWRREATACVVLTAEGYPGPYERGRVVEGIEDAMEDPDVVVFHSGTTRDRDGRLVTSGGRVLSVCARGRSLSTALKKSREAAEKVRFEGKHFRRDIGKGPLEILRERSGAFLR